MARYCLLEPGKPGATNAGGWDDYTETNDVLATLKAVYAPEVLSETGVTAEGCRTRYTTTHIAQIIDTDEDPPELVSRSCIDSSGQAGWVDV